MSCVLEVHSKNRTLQSLKEYKFTGKQPNYRLPLPLKLVVPSADIAHKYILVWVFVSDSNS